MIQTFRPTFRYWMETEVHVYGFSVAANVLLSFFPFLIVVISLSRYVLHWRAIERAVYLALTDYFPGETGSFLVRNLDITVSDRGPFQVASILLLLFTANGIFEPLEVALNRVWGVKSNRSFLRNQIVSMGLIFLCGGLIMISTMLTAFNQQLWLKVFGPDSMMLSVMSITAFKLAAVPISILILFLIYWLLPNRRIPPRQILPVAIVIGLLLEALKYVNLITWPWMWHKLENEYGPFKNSVNILLWSFVSAMVMLAGAEWAARKDIVATPAEGAPTSADPATTPPSRKS